MIKTPITTLDTAVRLSQRGTGVTDQELGEATGSVAIGAMAAFLHRLQKNGRLMTTGDTRDDRKIFYFNASGEPVNTVIDGMTVVAKDENPLLTFVELASRGVGATCKEVAEARSTVQFAPFARTAKKGVGLGILEATTDSRNNSTVYKVVDGLNFSISEGLDDVKFLMVDSITIKNAKKTKKMAGDRSTVQSAVDASRESIVNSFFIGMQRSMIDGKHTPQKLAEAFGKAVGAFVKELGEG